MLRTKQLSRVLILFIAATATSCVPGVAWLPDSSGFVYTSGKENRRLVRYDLANNEERTLVEDTDAGTSWPAVSPDGKRIALARQTRTKGVPETMQLVIYDMEGKELHRSIEFAWREAFEGEEPVRPNGAAVFWDPQGKKLVVYDFEPGKATTGIYDLAAKTLILLPGRPCVSATMPVRADGKGFVAVDGNEDGVAGVSFVDWDGNQRKIDMAPAAIDNKDKRNMLIMPFMCTGRWEGNTAILSWNTSSIRIDTDKITGTFHNLTDAQAQIDGKIIHQQYHFPNQGARVFVLERRGDGDKKKADFRVEVIRAGEESSRILIEDCGLCYFSPSPNRELLAIRCWVEEPQQVPAQRIVVVDRAGKVVNDIPVKYD